MSRIDDILGGAADAVDTAVRRMPEREAKTVETRSTRKSAMAGIGAVVVVVVVGLLGWVLLGGSGGGVDPIDEPDGAPTTVARGTPIPADPNAVAWPGGFEGEPGTYGKTLAGVPFSFELQDVGDSVPWQPLGRSPWELGLGHPRATEIGDRELVFMVAKRLSDPETLREPTWPVGDIDGWVEAVGSSVVVDGPTDVKVAGRPALRFTMKSKAPCENESGSVSVMPCDTLAFSGEGTGGQLFIDTTFAEVEVWWVPGVDGDAAFVAFASAYPSSWNAWGPTVESVVESLGIGE